ncbi:hypothetical protein [Isoptericola aurantiacus]|uniref:hypothetical protein n=1 Tax=Isoptericola aurantiacus TaxID=3377839 RepID=UPI00383AE684
MRFGRVVRRATAALAGTALLFSLTAAQVAVGSGTTSGSSKVATRDVKVTASASAPRTVLLRPGGSTMRIEVTFSTTGDALEVRDGASLLVGSRKDHHSWTGGDLELVGGTTYRATVPLGGDADARGSWDVFLRASVRSTFDSGAMAWDRVEFDRAKVASFRVKRPSKIDMWTGHYDGLTVLTGTASEKEGTIAGVTGFRPIPGAKVTVYFDPAGAATRRHVATTHTAADGTYRIERQQRKTGRWIVKMAATADHPSSTAARKVRVG